MLPVFTTQGDAPASGAEAPLGKVELDLEGAPFLEPEPEEVPEEITDGQARSSSSEELDEDAEAKKRRRKKLFIIFGAIFVGLVLIAIVGVYFLLFTADPKKDIPSDVEVVVLRSGPPPLAPAEVNKFNISWEPFWVEVADPEGEIRFVFCKIVMVTDNQRIALQIDNKQTTIRDAVYYYLRHKPYSFLADLRQLDVLKAEVLNIINYYILPETVIPAGLPPGEPPPPDSPKERLKEILIEEYLIK